MNAARFTMLSRVLGGLLLAIAGVRFAMALYWSIRVSGSSPTGNSFGVSFNLDHLTVCLGALGVVLLIFGFREGKKL